MNLTSNEKDLVVERLKNGTLPKGLKLEQKIKTICRQIKNYDVCYYKSPRKDYPNTTYCFRKVGIKIQMSLLHYIPIKNIYVSILSELI